MIQDRPDWVMVGSPRSEGGVSLIASKELTQGQLEMERDIHELFDSAFFGPVGIAPGPPRYTISVEMRNYVLIMAPTYSEAFSALFRQWSPEPDPRQELGGPAMIDS